MNRDFICSSCGNEWSQKADNDGLCDGYGLPSCPICGTSGSETNDYRDFVCPQCKHEWRNYGNGGLAFGCWPNCPNCGTTANKAQKKGFSLIGSVLCLIHTTTIAANNGNLAAPHATMVLSGFTVGNDVICGCRGAKDFRSFAPLEINFH